LRKKNVDGTKKKKKKNTKRDLPPHRHLLVHRFMAGNAET
jgi:hypothetical protein